VSASTFQDLVQHSEAVQIAIGKREENLDTVRFQRDRTGGLRIRPWAYVYTYRYKHALGRGLTPDGLNGRASAPQLNVKVISPSTTSAID